MPSNPTMPSDHDLDALLAAISDTLDLPPMADGVTRARQRIEARAATQSRQESMLPASPTRNDRAAAFQPKEILQLPLEEQQSKIREFGLLAAGLAAAAILSVALTFVFGGFDRDGGSAADEPTALPDNHPLAAQPFNLPGYEFERSIGRPQVPNIPTDVVTTPNGGFYVVDSGLGRVVALNPDGSVREEWGDQGFSAPFDGITGAGLAPNGQLYVVANELIELDADGRVVSETQLPISDAIVPNSVVTGTHTGPAIDNSGNVYVGHSGENVIWRLAPDGEWLSIDLGEDGLVGPVSDADGNIFAMTYAGRILQVLPNGQLETVTRLEDLGDVIDLTVAADGFSVLIGDLNLLDEMIVAHVDRAGGDLSVWNTGVLVASSAREQISAIAITPSGDVIVADPTSGHLQRFSIDGEHLEALGEDGPGLFHFLWRIALDGAGSVYALDPLGVATVQVFDRNGNSTDEFDVVQGDESPGERGVPLVFANPLLDAHGLAATDSGVVITGANRGAMIRVYDDGDVIDSWGDFGFGEDGLFAPTSIAAVGDDALYVSDDNGTIKEYTLDGELVRVLGELVSDRRDLLYHDDAIWAVDGTRILRYPLDGSEREIIASSTFAEDDPGEIPGQLLSLAVTPDDNVLVFSVDILSMDELQIGQIPFVPTLSMIGPNGSLLWTQSLEPSPTAYLDLAIADDGTVYLGDSEQRQILVYRPVERPGNVLTITPTHERAAETSPADMLVIKNINEPGSSQQYLLMDPYTHESIALPRGEIVGVSPDGTKILLIDQEPREERLRLDLFAVSTETFQELWRTDIGERAESGPNTIYFDTLVTEGAAYVAFHDPDYRTDMLEIGEVRLSDGWMLQNGAVGLDTNVTLGEPGIDVDLLVAESSSRRTILVSNTNSGELLAVGRDVFTNYADFGLPDGTPYVLPNDDGLFVVPPNGFHERPAVFHLPFNGGGRGQGPAEVVLPFDTVRSNDGAFVTYMLAPDGRTLYALSLDNLQVAVVDLVNLELTEIVDLSDVPIYSLTGDTEWTTLTPFYAEHPMVLSSDGRYLFCLGFPRDHEGSITITPAIWKIDTTSWAIVDDWAPETPWVAYGLSLGNMGDTLYVSLGEITSIVDPGPGYRPALESPGFSLLTSESLEDVTGYVPLGDFEILGTLEDLQRFGYRAD